MRVSGHELKAEGAAFQPGESPNWRFPRRVQMNTTAGRGFGLCSCGARSPIFDSANMRKAWHRTHKAQVFVCESCGQPAGVTLKDGSFWCHSCDGSARRLGYSSAEIVVTPLGEIERAGTAGPLTERSA